MYGKAGTGKTTLGKLITKQVPCDYLYINASDENNVDTFAQRLSLSQVVWVSMTLKLFIDECDFLTGKI